VSLFDQVAAIVRPRKRRRLSEEHKARLVASGRPFRRKFSESRSELSGVLGGYRPKGGQEPYGSPQWPIKRVV
jgi:hypothetical protein